MHPLYYLSFLILTFVHLGALTIGGAATLAPIAFSFLALPILDYALGTHESNPASAELARWSRRGVWGSILMVYVVTHAVVLTYGLILAARSETPWWEIMVIGVSTGIYTGALGITVAHELAHKRGPWARGTAQGLLISVLYHHFYIEHLRGHHVNVGTPSDPASARLGESAYAFVRRSVVGSWREAFRIDRRRALLGAASQLAVTIGVGVAWGGGALACFLTQALVAISLLELINYVEHYGLKREALGGNRYERVAVTHSWNSSHRLTNAMLFNLQRHSDHHARAALPFTALSHHDEVPQLPFGYPTMLLMALYPPLWFRIMNPRALAWARSARAA